MPDIAAWLAQLGLDKYIGAFTANEVDMDALRAAGTRGRAPAADRDVHRPRGFDRVVTAARPGGNAQRLGAYQSAVSAEIARYEGYVAKLMGDGVLAYFG